MSDIPPIDATALLKELRDTTPITAQRKRIDEFLAMGDASTRKDEACVLSSIKPSATIPQPSEISVPTDNQLVKLMLKSAAKTMNWEEGMKLALKALRPYLRTTDPVNTDANYWKTRYLLLEAKTKPVSVLLEKIEEVISDEIARQEEANNDSTLEAFRLDKKCIAKAVMEAGASALVKPEPASAQQPDGHTYECHITVGCPSGSKELELFEQLGRTYKWKTSIIHGDPQLGKDDFFYFTRHAGTFAKMKEQMDLMVRVLKNENVLRQKIEHIIFDTKTGIDTSVPMRESGTPENDGWLRIEPVTRHTDSERKIGSYLIQFKYDDLGNATHYKTTQIEGGGETNGNS